jgi:putative RNA 2'-phosphotransferase
MSQEQVRTSKFLSLILRHHPAKIGIVLDENGWADIDELIEAANRRGKSLSRELIDRVVAENDKQRFSISADGTRIRANQGHSLRDIDLSLTPQIPPEVLFHGTVERFLDSIRQQGLQKRSRNHVHLSPDQETATKVGMRRGKPIILRIHACKMHDQGIEFFLSENGVWLTDHVALEFIEFPD